MTPEHVESRTIKETIITPAHGKRDLSAFRKSVKMLKQDNLYRCFVCGSQAKLQVHHIAEFSLANTVDYEKLKKFLLCFDVYGYSRKMIDVPLTSIDDVRNLMVLCQPHHNNVNKLGTGTGIHNMSFPGFVSQCVCNDNENPVPQENESIEEVLNRVD
jgi:hypothetical protein